MAERRRAIGAELVAGGVEFRVWAPAHERVSVVIDGREHPLARERGGYFRGVVAGAEVGTLYRFRVGEELFPDPASRFQPEGPHGASQVVDPSAFQWTDRKWRGPSAKGLVISEMHVGTFTREGTFRAAIEQLPHLADVGINLLEVMPVSEFPGQFGWGYDGVDLFAPTRLYGGPDAFRAFVDAAHRLGIGVILDVVYNHVGPDGSYLKHFTPRYFSDRYENEWGEPLNFDGEDAEGVREFFAENAAYWVDEFHLDGLRLDATQSMFDESEEHVICTITKRAREAAGDRTLLFIAENEPQDVTLVDEYGVDAMWNDDWHHGARVAATGRIEAYYTDYRGTAQELVSMAKFGFLYQGQRYRWQKKRRGTPAFHVPPEKLVCYLQNHDQIANSATGARIHELTSPGRFRALTALLLLAPQTPMLFQGQEFAASAPFLYFADHEGELAKKVTKGRKEFLSQFPSIAAPEMLERLRAPEDVATFEACKLDHSERESHGEIVALHRDLIRLRRGDPAFAAQRTDVLHGAVLSESAFVLRWLLGDDDDRLLIVNLGRAFELDPAPEPLLAPVRDGAWEVLWSSESPAYGGRGMAAPESEKEGWKVPAEAAVVLRPAPRDR